MRCIPLGNFNLGQTCSNTRQELDDKEQTERLGESSTGDSEGSNEHDGDFIKLDKEDNEEDLS